MKTTRISILCVATLVLATVNAASANDQYVETMQKCIGELYHATEITELQQTVNKLERISAAENGKWEPLYYSAFGYIMMTTRETDGAKKDAYLDRAMKAIAKAKVLMPAESEIIALEGFVHMMRVTVDPQSRGQEFAPKAMQSFGHALKLNPENPRALALSAQMQYGSAQFFGNSTAEACALATKALEELQQQKPASELAPVWGEVMAKTLVGQCQ